MRATSDSARVRLPALIVYVAVLNEGVGREQEWQHLKNLPGHADLALDRLNGNFLRLRCDGFTVKWERHTEFTRYSIVQPLPAHAGWGSVSPELASQVVTGTAWLRAIPGRTVAAIHLGMLAAPVDAPDTVAQAQAWHGVSFLTSVCVQFKWRSSVRAGGHAPGGADAAGDVVAGDGL